MIHPQFTVAHPVDLDDEELEQLQDASTAAATNTLERLGPEYVVQRLLADLSRAHATAAAVREVHTRTEVDVLRFSGCGEDGDCDHGTPGHADECPTMPFGVCAHELAVLVEKFGEEEAHTGRIPDGIDWPCATIKALDGMQQ
jgi:hypothetical protein